MWRASLLALRQVTSTPRTRGIHPKVFSRAAFVGSETSSTASATFSTPLSPSPSSSASSLKATHHVPVSDAFAPSEMAHDTAASSPSSSSNSSSSSSRDSHLPIEEGSAWTSEHDSVSPELHQQKEDQRQSALVPFPSTTHGRSARHKKRGVTFPLLPAPSRRVIVHELNELIRSLTATANEVSAAPLTGRQLWGATRLARENKHIRRTQQVCVVGGKDSIQRIWNEYRIRPHVVYVSNVRGMEEEEEEREHHIHDGEGKYNDSTSGVTPHSHIRDEVPSWCFTSTDLPTYIVRCPPVDIQRHLLSASLSTPYAAEFPWHPSQLLPLSYALKTHVETDTTKKEEPPAPDVSSTSSLPHPQSPPSVTEKGEKNIPSMLVLVGLRIPSNVGMLIHAAESMGFSSVALIHCVDPFQEKVLRSSYGSVLSPKLQLYEYDEHTSGTSTMSPAASSSVVSLLCTIAAQHHLMPLLAVPSQEEEPAFQVAKRFHSFNAAAREPKVEEGMKDPSCSTLSVLSTAVPLGPMIVLGGESRGLEALADAPWTVPYQTLTLPIPNAMVDSFNVGVAGSILMDLFRPSAEGHFKQIEQITGPSPNHLVEEA